LKLGRQAYVLNHLVIRIPTRPRNFIYLTLQASDHQLSFIDNPALNRGSITLTDCAVSIALSKKVDQRQPRGQIGIDVNERNVTWSDSSGRTENEDTSEVAELKERYRAVRAKIAERTQSDTRVRRRVSQNMESGRRTGQSS